MNEKYLKRLFILFMVLLAAGVGAAVIIIAESGMEGAQSGTRRYVFEAPGEEDCAYITLGEDYTFEFSCSLLCSYRGFGNYTIQENEMYCRTDDGKYEYVFVVEEDGTLVFDGQRSWKLPVYSKIKDGSVFE